MHNWSTDITRLKNHFHAYMKWKMEQLINYGLGDEKLDEVWLKEHIDELHIDKAKRDYLHFLLWGTQS